MNQYMQEFGPAFELGFCVDDFPFLVDKSWHQDSCPSFMFKTHEGYAVLWVDYLSKDERKNSSAARYAVVTASNLGSESEPEIYHDEHSFTLFTAEDSADLYAYLLELEL
ncbi:hypothetical protein [uncultured Shewanella sp.]|uniref:hypothetical protein n=1 Tax=uncultured Shewanella sp. TaxID=173975 RepID=UPI002636BC29|nr:hypothetical protein [uncultured Shewanella sp.]